MDLSLSGSPVEAFSYHALSSSLVDSKEYDGLPLNLYRAEPPLERNLYTPR